MTEIMLLPVLLCCLIGLLSAGVPFFNLSKRLNYASPEKYLMLRII